MMTRYERRTKNKLIEHIREADELVADSEKTIEICSREILRLEARERDLEAENEALRERGFVYTSENGRELLVRMWNDEPWIFYKHPDGQWVSLEKIALLTGGDDEVENI
jgi:hypothetical protein